ncbi:uncharacterized protein SAPINGB_P002067 [Magnusiomyces paraingens]|uniref:YbgI/family dinuclear metal center protein n=1 Tax=Magnusiomyces paraingens TaxID=2606893 RepID=A0A5E8BE86_9ASCO|nr:uncharacterized protein SAPINGB_P002067 [Saprochaete ingens]VVT49025.1 unnamed protein product [Saprochaete ingens]
MASQRAVNIIKSTVARLYPKELAENAWDNTGLLLECPPQTSTITTTPEKIKVLLAIDLTRAVASEAIDSNVSFIVAYHPFIFRGIKAISLNDPQHLSLVRLVQAGISVYCPHTAIDAATGGVNDWLADGVSGGPAYESQRTVCTPPGSQNVEGHEDAGMGRRVELKTPITFGELVTRVKKHLGLDHVQVARATSLASDSQLISSVALCAGSGASVLRGIKADVHLTGELGHHELLHLTETGTSAIICGHSNTERGFLTVLQKQLTDALKQDYDGPSEVAISKTDKDPLEFA